MSMPEGMLNTGTAAGGDQVTEQVTEQVGTGDTGQVTQEPVQTVEQKPEKTFTQAQLDEIVKGRLDREQSKFETEKPSIAQQARDAWITEQGWAWKGKLLTTEAEYKQALEEEALEKMIESRGYDPNEIAQVVSAHPDVKKAREYMTSQEEKSRKTQEGKDFTSRRDSMYEDFLTEFPDYSTEEKQKDIPKEVWMEADKWLKSGGREGRRLADAMTRHNYKQGLSQQQTGQANQANAQTSTGSAKGQGTPDSGYISAAVFEANKNDRTWVIKNLSKITQSRTKW